LGSENGIDAPKGYRLITRSRLIGVAVTALIAAFAMAQDTAKDAGITRGQADAILDELKQIRQLLERQQTTSATPPLPTRGKLKSDGGYTLGSKDAAVTMVEFTDYECPFCRQFESATFGEIRKKYIDTGKVLLVVRNLPLSIHSNAMRAAQAALCAGDQGQFWGMNDLLFSGSAENLGGEGILHSARKLPMDVSVFKSCLDGGKHIPDVLKDQQDAAALQLSGTPSFLIGKVTGGVVDGSILMGAQPFAVFDSKLGDLLAGK
jgi:protein-disulfide isomerase